MNTGGMSNKPTLHTIQLPEQGTVNFWDAKGTQYSLKWVRDDAWELYVMRAPGKATPLADIRRHPEFFEAIQTNGPRDFRAGDWITAVQWGVRYGG